MYEEYDYLLRCVALFKIILNSLVQITIDTKFINSLKCII